MWTTVVAVISAALGGAFGVPFKIAAIGVTLILLYHVVTVFIAFALVIVSWLCQQVADFIKSRRNRDH